MPLNKVLRLCLPFVGFPTMQPTRADLGSGSSSASSCGTPPSGALTPSQVLNSNLFELNRGTFDPRAAAAAMLAAAGAAAASGFDPGAAAAAAASAAGIPQCCSSFCAAGCRRQVLNHPRGVVCTTCMPSDKWRRCTGCAAVAHYLCVGDLELDSWKCPSCDKSTSTPTDDCVDPGGPKVVHDAANPSAKSNSNSTEDCEERQIFQTEGEMYTTLRDQGYRISNTQANGKTWQCSWCSKTFYSKKSKDGIWSCPLSIVHEDECSRPVKPVVKEEEAEGRNKAAVQYFHELGKYPGLLEYIEILGCTDELRADAMQRAVRKKFGVHVSAGLLYRTAKKAHDEMFGSNISDIEELLKMSSEVGDEGGFLKLFTGDISVYTLCQT